MPSRDQIQKLLDRGRSIEDAARELGIPAGQAHLIVTGDPADGGAHPAQDLVNDRHHNPLRNPTVTRWVRERASRELSRPS